MKAVHLFHLSSRYFVRRDSSGIDVGNEYLSHCVRSWRDNHFEPISINSRLEGESHIVRELGLARIDVDRNAQDLCGKPLVYLTDFLRGASSVGECPVAITNSDILLDIPSGTMERIAAIKPGECFVARRVDIQSMDVREGEEYQFGYDFFAYHTKDVRCV